jgi:hypothetical protein
MKYSTVVRLLTVTGLASLTVSCQSSLKTSDGAPPSNIVASPDSGSSSTASPTVSPTTTPSATASPTVATSPVTKRATPPTGEQSGAQQSTEASTPTSETSPVKVAKATTTAKAINIYKVDAQCNGLFPQKVEVSGPVDANAAVGQVIANSNSPDFRVVNYRVNVENGTATIDLRLPANAKRPFSALSACEQLELFGSLEKTLTNNPSLQVQSVRFRDGEKELQF